MIGVLQVMEIYINDVAAEHNGYMIVETSNRDHVNLYFEHLTKELTWNKLVLKITDIRDLYQRKATEYWGLRAMSGSSKIEMTFEIRQFGPGTDDTIIRTLVNHPSTCYRIFEDFEVLRAHLIKNAPRKYLDISLVYRHHLNSFIRAYIYMLSTFGDISKRDCKKVIKNHRNFRQFFMTMADIELKYVNSVTTFYMGRKCCKNCERNRCEYKCGNCLAVYYCDVVCQTVDWKYHQKECSNAKFEFDNIYNKQPLRIESYFQGMYKRKIISFRKFKKLVSRKLEMEFYKSYMNGTHNEK